MRRSRIAGEGDVEAHFGFAAVRPLSFPGKMKQRHAAEPRRFERRVLLLRLETLEHHAGEALAHVARKSRLSVAKGLVLSPGGGSFSGSATVRISRKNPGKLHDAIVRAPGMPVARAHRKAELRIEFARRVQVVHRMNDVIEPPFHASPGSYAVGCRAGSVSSMNGDNVVSSRGWENPMSQNPIDGFTVDPSQIGHIGSGLQRPECILAERDGSLWAADARGGVVHIRPDGSQQLVTQQAVADFSSAASDVERFTKGTLPNGLAFARNGDIVISNFGTDRLEVMTRNGETRVLVDAIEGEPIGKVNFVLRDRRDRLWLTVSTRIKDWMKAISPKIKDGFIALYDRGELRIVADGFAFTNEIRFDANEEWLYVVETCGPCITRFRADAGRLSLRPRNFRGL
jgi:hypothetical protein